jgi:glycosyltransferase involved in cell wall biosynthesis
MSVPTISVITAAYAPTAEYILETAESISGAQLPADWDLEWIVQEDGAEPGLREIVTRYPFTKYAAIGRRYGTASTRNLALSRAAGVLVQALDQDDLLLPGVFKTLIPRFAQYRIAWAIGQADDLLPDGSRRVYPSPIGFGLQQAGEINRWAEEHGGNWPVHCATLMMRTDPLRALGGWTGLPGDDELATFAALSEIADGYYDQELTWLYRHHSQQMHRTAAASERSSVCRRASLQRARAVARTGLRFGETAVSGFDPAADEVQVGPVDKDTTISSALTR